MLNNTGTIRAVKIRQRRGLLVVCLLATSISFDFDWFLVLYISYILRLCVFTFTHIYIYSIIYTMFIYMHWAWLTKSFWHRIACCTVELWMRRNAIVLMHRWRCRFGMPFRFGVGSGRLTKRSCEKWREFLWLENPQAKVTDGAQVSRLTIEFQNLS